MAVFDGAIFMLVDDPVAARRAVTAAFPGRLYGVSGNIARDDVAALQGTYDYEGRAAMAVAVIAVVAGLIFVGQTLACQVRREWTDLASLRSIGMSDAQIGATALDVGRAHRRGGRSHRGDGLACSLGPQPGRPGPKRPRFGPES